MTVYELVASPSTSFPASAAPLAGTQVCLRPRKRPLKRQRNTSSMEKTSHVYIMASRPYGTLYIGVTSDLVKRVWQHRGGFVDGFTKQHRTHLLVWYETHTDIIEAITREKQLKHWNRDWKINLIQSTNPAWHDLYARLL